MKTTDENLLGYLLDGLDDASQREVEAFLGNSPEARQRLALLQRVIEPLAADSDEIAPPPDLYYRTLGRVAEYCSRHELPRAPSPSRLQAFHRPRWRRVEFLVAASILLIVIGAAVSALVHVRNSTASYAQCKNNLRVFFTALNAYHDQHKHFPDVKAEAPQDVAGMVVPVLLNAGVVDPSELSVRCPANGTARPCPVTYDQAKALGADEFRSIAPKLMSCYAYALGYYDETGHYHPPQQRDGSNARLPLLSDRPPYDMSTNNSPNHGGTGQNVLFQDGHVDFMTVRYITDYDSDIFLNRARKVQAGLDPDDACLGASSARP